MATTKWHEIRLSCRSQRDANDLLADLRFQQAIDAVFESTRSLHDARTQVWRPSKEKRGGWVLSLCLGATRAMPRTVSKFTRRLSRTLGREAASGWKRRPPKNALGMRPGDPSRPKARDPNATHRYQPYSDAELRELLSHPPTEPNVERFAQRLARTPEAIRVIYNIASTRKKYLHPERAGGAFWRQVRRVAGELGWLTIGSREHEDLQRTKGSDASAADDAGAPDDAGHWYCVGRSAPNSPRLAFAFEIRDDAHTRFALRNVTRLNAAEREMLVEHFNSPITARTGGELEGGIHAQARWREIEGVFPRKKGKKGFEGQRKSYVESHPTHLLSGTLKCGTCGGAMALVSGKGSGYYGCLGASRHACDNKKLISRKRLEKRFLAALNEEVLRPEVLEAVYERTAKKVREHFSHVPEALRLKKVELNRAETRVRNFIEFIAEGRATPGLADALAQAEEQVKELSADIASMETAKDHVFTPPPKAWIADRLEQLDEVLAQPALALRRLTGPVTLTPQQPEVGRSYFQASCKVYALSLVADGGSNSSQWWRRRESNRKSRVGENPLRIATLATYRPEIVRLPRPAWFRPVPLRSPERCRVTAT